MKLICSAAQDCADTDCPAHEPHDILTGGCDHKEFWCPEVDRFIHCEPTEEDIEEG